MESRTITEEMLCSKVLFNECELTYDMLEKRFFYSLVEGDDSSYNPYVEYISQKKDLKIAVVGGEIRDDIIAMGEEYTILFYTDDLYQLMPLVFTTLPLLSINYEGDMGEHETKQCEFKLFDNRSNATQRVIKSEAEIRYRGGYSRTYPKDGYRLTLYTYSVGGNRRELDTSLLGMRQDGDWILYAGYNDQEKIRNVFCSKLWKESCAENNSFGIDNGMEYKYVELFIKGQYWGLYALGYPIDALQLQMTDNEYMYKKINIEQSELMIDYNAEGLVLEYSIKELGNNNEESWEPLKEYYKAMQNGENNYAELQEWSDMQNCIDIFLFLNLIQGVDHVNLRGQNTIYNLYMTNKLCNDGQTECMIYTPWDMDRTWGNGFNDEIYNVPVEHNVVMQLNIVYLLLEQGDLRVKEELCRRYKELRESTWSNQYIMELLTRYEEDIFDSGAYKRDKIRWPDGNYSVEEEKLNVFKQYVINRLRYMDKFMSNYG